jgi:hypothetical protein
MRRSALIIILVLAALASGPTASAVAGPVLNLDLHHSPTNFPSGGRGEYWIDVSNLGDEATSGPITLTVNLPSGLTRKSVTVGDAGPFGAYNLPWSCPGSPGATTVVCTTNGSIPRFEAARDIFVIANVAANASGARLAKATVTGGGSPAAPPASGCAALVAACAQELTPIGASPAGFGIGEGSFVADFFEADGVTPVRQSGAHPPVATFAFDFTSIAGPKPNDPDGQRPAGDARHLQVDLPPGFLGDPTAVSECTPAELTVANCPVESQVGIIDLSLVAPEASHVWNRPTGVFLMTHPRGAITDLGFSVVGNPVHVRASLDPANGYSIRTTVDDINETLPPFGSKLTIWGVPADPSHDSQRCPGWVGFTDKECASSSPRKAFITVPFQCETDMRMKLTRYDSWQASGSFGPDVFYDLPGQFTGCDKSQAEFHPAASIAPSAARADTPTGLSVDVSVPFNNDPDGIMPSPVKRFQVKLPVGVTVNPSFADGLEGCTEEQIGISHSGIPDKDPVTCPDQSRIGAMELSTTLLPKPAELQSDCPGTAALQGSLYLAKQQANPLDSLFAIYAIVHDCEHRGVLVKLPGRMDLDPETGQITTTFDDLPQFPFDHLSVQFRSGDRAPLINPSTCGTKVISGTFNTWAQPEVDVPVNSSYAVTEGSGGAPCSSDAAARPFAPRLSAGAANPLAGAYSPFILRVSRNDGEQELTKIALDLPKGLAGKLAGVQECPDSVLASIPTAAGTGAAEKANPSCPPGSEVGYLNAGSGAGPLPFYIRGSVYLAGPYKGAPLSIAAVTPAVAGGIDLGNVVIRTALHVDPADSHIHAVSDPLPTILHGVPIHLRDVRVVMDRPNFTINPTNCSEMPVRGEAGGAGASLADPGDDVSAPLTDRFQVGGCADLPFKPKISFRLKGGTHRGDYPAFSSTLTARPGDSNIGSAVVALPHSEFLAQNHIRTVCTRVQFAADQCPPGSIYGSARAVTPLLSEPIEGQVILRSSDNPLPDLVAVLKGKISANLVGRIDAVHGGIRTTFDRVPDVPVTEFTLAMKGGKAGLLENSRNLCNRPARVQVTFVGQNGKVALQRPVLRNSCKPKAKGKRRHGKHRKHKRHANKNG